MTLQYPQSKLTVKVKLLANMLAVQNLLSTSLLPAGRARKLIKTTTGTVTVKMRHEIKKSSWSSDSKMKHFNSDTIQCLLTQRREEVQITISSGSCDIFNKCAAPSSRVDPLTHTCVCHLINSRHRPFLWINHSQLWVTLKYINQWGFLSYETLSNPFFLPILS